MFHIDYNQIRFALISGVVVLAIHQARPHSNLALMSDHLYIGLEGEFFCFMIFFHVQLFAHSL